MRVQKAIAVFFDDVIDHPRLLFIASHLPLRRERRWLILLEIF
jgi:hypothetical protein